MEFLRDNYMWIIITVIVILMTIIGYIAEKTNFGKKEFSKRKIDKKEKLSSKTKIPEESSEPVQDQLEAKEEAIVFENEVGKEDVEFTDPIADDMSVSSNTLNSPEVLQTEEDLNAPFGETLYTEIDTANPEEDLNVPFGEEFSYEVPAEEITQMPMEDLNAPLGDFSDTVVTSEASDMFPEEDLNAPFGDNISSQDDFNLDLPDIDSIKEDVPVESSTESDDDDIWKF